MNIYDLFLAPESELKAQSAKTMEPTTTKKVTKKSAKAKK